MKYFVLCFNSPIHKYIYVVHFTCSILTQEHLESPVHTQGLREGQRMNMVEAWLRIFSVLLPLAEPLTIINQ